MATIAFSIIGHNNGHQLARCLDSVRWADEIVYVDCESSDGSLEIARRYTERVYQRPNTTNLNVNKSYGFAQATADWIFYLDPDEVIPPALAEEIRTRIAADPPENAFALPRRNHYFGQWLRHGGQYPDTQARLFRRGKARFACLHVHERLEVEGPAGRLREAMWHYPCDTVGEQIRKVDFYSSFNADVMARQGVRPTARVAFAYLLAKPASRFARRYLFKGGFLDGWAGLIVIALSSLDFALRFFKLWEITSRGETGVEPRRAPPAPAPVPESVRNSPQAVRPEPTGAR
jgi:glycosyltransferase involved in cell wall biosynthesis